MALVLGQKRSKVEYINERCAMVANKTAEEAVGTMVPNKKGAYVRYSSADLQYDIKGGRLSRMEITPAMGGASKTKSRTSSFLSPAEPDQRKSKGKQKPQKRKESAATAVPRSSGKRKRASSVVVNYADTQSCDSESECSEGELGDDGSSSQGKGKGRSSASKVARTTSSTPTPSSTSATSGPAPTVQFASGSASDLNRQRTVHIIGGEGGAKCTRADGKCDVVLAAGEGLRELKVKVRKAFGKAPRRKMGSFMLVGADGETAGRKAESKHLIEGTTVRCTYAYASGHIGNLHGGGGRRRSGGWSMGGSSHAMVMAMLMARHHGGFGGFGGFGHDSDGDY
jgi:hypothetical protein